MDIPEEIMALRTEHDHLRARLENLEGRILALERIPGPEPEKERPPRDIPLPPPLAASAPPPIPEAPPATVPAVSAPPPPAPAPVPKTMATDESLELRLGRVWLARIGIVILLTGLVFLGNYAYHELIVRLGAGGKLALLYLAGAALGGIGGWLARRQAGMRNYGRVLLAGGCATIYYATYAAHFVPTLRVIESPFVGGTLLLALGGAFAVLADRRRSQLLAGATIALSYYTAAINADGTFSLFSNLVISAVAVVLLARRRWMSVTFLSLAGSYGSFAFWRLHNSGSLLPLIAPDAPAFWTAVLFPAAYWAVHTIAVTLRRMNGLAPEARPAFLTLNNAAFFALAGPAIAGTHPDAFWLATAGFGTILLALAVVAARIAPDEQRFDRAYLAQGLALVALGLFLKFTGWQLALSFALLSSTLITLGRLRHGDVYRFFAGASGLVATTVAFGNLIQDQEHARLVAAGAAAILVANAWLLKRADGFGRSFDWRALFFALLSGVLAAAACIDQGIFPSALRLLGLAAAAQLLLRRHRLPEAAYVAQPLAFLGQALLIVRFFAAPNPATTTSVLCGLAFVHLWQWQANSGLVGRRVWQTLHALAPVGLGLAWCFTQLSDDTRGPVLALAALGLLSHGLVFRLGVTATATLPFTITAIGSTSFAISQTLPWPDAALTIALIATQSPLVARFGERLAIRESSIATLRSAIHFVALALVAASIFAYLPESNWFLALTGLGFAFFLVASAAGSAEALFYAAALGIFAIFVWVSRLPVAPASWPDVFGFLAFAAAQRIGRRRLALAGRFGPAIQAALSVAAGLGSWILLHRLVSHLADGFLVTVAWSLLALVLLGGGFAMKERTYRQLGLLILAAAVVRIFAVDVWQLDTLFRILSFLVLGIVLLVLGFLYNRFADALRKWL
jgi:hypothetical protein